MTFSVTFAGKIAMEEELELFLTNADLPIESDFYATPNAQVATQGLDLTAIKTASVVGLTKDYSVDYRDMAEEEAILGNLGIVSTIVECLADAKLLMEEEDVRRMDSFTTPNVNQGIMHLVAASADLLFPIAIL